VAERTLFSMGSGITDSFSIFEKYRSGSASISSVFRLYSTDISHEASSEGPGGGPRVRGAYRKYTREEKEVAVFKVLSRIVRF
jgi:hypothetical protein